MVISLYSTSQELFDIVPFFFDFQDMREFPRYTLKPVTDCLETLQVPQSLSQKAFKRVEMLEEKNKPRLEAPLIYLRIQILHYSEQLQAWYEIEKVFAQKRSCQVEY